MENPIFYFVKILITINQYDAEIVGIFLPFTLLLVLTDIKTMMDISKYLF